MKQLTECYKLSEELHKDGPVSICIESPGGDDYFGDSTSINECTAPYLVTPSQALLNNYDSSLDAERLLEELGFAGLDPSIPERFIPSLIKRISVMPDPALQSLNHRILQALVVHRRKEFGRKLFRSCSVDGQSRTNRKNLVLDFLQPPGENLSNGHALMRSLTGPADYSEEKSSFLTAGRKRFDYCLKCDKCDSAGILSAPVVTQDKYEINITAVTHGKPTITTACSDTSVTPDVSEALAACKDCSSLSIGENYASTTSDTIHNDFCRYLRAEYAIARPNPILYLNDELCESDNESETEFGSSGSFSSFAIKSQDCPIKVFVKQNDIPCSRTIIINGNFGHLLRKTLPRYDKNTREIQLQKQFFDCKRTYPILYAANDAVLISHKLLASSKFINESFRHPGSQAVTLDLRSLTNLPNFICHLMVFQPSLINTILLQMNKKVSQQFQNQFFLYSIDGHSYIEKNSVRLVKSCSLTDSSTHSAFHSNGVSSYLNEAEDYESPSKDRRTTMCFKNEYVKKNDSSSGKGQRTVEKMNSEPALNAGDKNFYVTCEAIDRRRLFSLSHRIQSGVFENRKKRGLYRNPTLRFLQLLSPFIVTDNVRTADTDISDNRPAIYPSLQDNACTLPIAHMEETNNLSMSSTPNVTHKNSDRHRTYRSGVSLIPNNEESDITYISSLYLKLDDRRDSRCSNVIENELNSHENTGRIKSSEGKPLQDSFQKATQHLHDLQQSIQKAKITRESASRELSLLQQTLKCSSAETVKSNNESSSQQRLPTCLNSCDRVTITGESEETDVQKFIKPHSRCTATSTGEPVCDFRCSWNVRQIKKQQHRLKCLRKELFEVEKRLRRDISQLEQSASSSCACGYSGESCSHNPNRIDTLQSMMLLLQNEVSDNRRALSDLQKKSRLKEQELRQHAEEAVEKEWVERLAEAEARLQIAESKLQILQQENSQLRLIVKEQHYHKNGQRLPNGSPFICNGFTSDSISSSTELPKVPSLSHSADASQSYGKLSNELRETEDKADRLSLMLDQKLIELNQLQLALSKRTKEMVNLERAYLQLRCQLKPSHQAVEFQPYLQVPSRSQCSLSTSSTQSQCSHAVPDDLT